MAARFWIPGGSNILDNVSVGNISASTGGASTGTPLAVTDTLTIDAALAGGTVIMGPGTIGMQSLTMNTMVGTLTAVANAPTVNISLAAPTLASTGTSTRSILLGASVWNITSTSLSTILNFGVTTGLTFNAGTSIINILGANAGRMTMNLAGLIWNEINLLATGRGSYNILGNGATINTLKIIGRQDVVLESSRTFTIPALVLDGVDISNMINIAASDSTGIATIANSGGFTGDYLALRRLAFTGAGAKVANNSIDLGLNTGITINPPAIGGGSGGNTKYWNGAAWVTVPVNRFNGAAWEAA